MTGSGVGLIILQIGGRVQQGPCYLPGHLRRVLMKAATRLATQTMPKKTTMPHPEENGATCFRLGSYQAEGYRPKAGPLASLCCSSTSGLMGRTPK